MHARNVALLCVFSGCTYACRFHAISEFDDAKRSCRRRLAGHNERRRKSNASEAMARGVAHPHGTCPSVRPSVSQSVSPSYPALFSDTDTVTVQRGRLVPMHSHTTLRLRLWPRSPHTQSLADVS